MRTRALLLLAGLIAPAAVVPARAHGFTCEVKGSAGEFQVRRITTTENLGMSLEMNLTLKRPTGNVTSGKDYHIFGGVWVLRASDLASYSFGFLDGDWEFNPGTIRVVWQGQGVSLPTPSQGALVLSSAQGAYAVGSYLRADTYYIVGFGDGAGTWSGKLNLGGDEVPCPEVSIPGGVVGYDATDFTGGTQVIVPGYGTASGARLSFTNDYRSIIGALYFYEPSPFPPASVLITADASSVSRSQTIQIFGGTARDWTLTGSYTGKTNTILLEMLQLDLVPG